MNSGKGNLRAVADLSDHVIETQSKGHGWLCQNSHMYTVYMCHVDQKCEPEKGRLTSKQLALS